MAKENGNGRPTVSETVNKAFGKNADWVDKDELLDVVYWGKQIIAFIFGIIYGLMPFTSIWALGTYVVLSTLIFNHYVFSYQEQDQDEMGGFMEVAKEGFGSALATFLVSWITVYSLIHFE